MQNYTFILKDQIIGICLQILKTDYVHDDYLKIVCYGISEKWSTFA
jgi:hypothetical protein